MSRGGPVRVKTRRAWGVRACPFEPHDLTKWMMHEMLRASNWEGRQSCDTSFPTTSGVPFELCYRTSLAAWPVWMIGVFSMASSGYCGRAHRGAIFRMSTQLHDCWSTFSATFLCLFVANDLSSVLFDFLAPRNVLSREESLAVDRRLPDLQSILAALGLFHARRSSDCLSGSIAAIPPGSRYRTSMRPLQPLRYHATAAIFRRLSPPRMPTSARGVQRMMEALRGDMRR